MVKTSCLGLVQTTPDELIEIMSMETHLGGYTAYLDSEESTRALEGGHSIISPVQSRVSSICSLSDGDPWHAIDGETYGIFGGKPSPGPVRGILLLMYQAPGRKWSDYFEERILCPRDRFCGSVTVPIRVHVEVEVGSLR